MHTCTHRWVRDVKLLNTLSGSSTMLLLWRYLCREWRGQCATTDQLIIVFCGSRIFSLRILRHHAIVQYSMQCIVSCMHFQPFQRHQGFWYILMDQTFKYYQKKPVRGPREPVSSLEDFVNLDFDCNQRTQYLLAILCVLVYIFRETGLIFLGFAVAHWKWICKAFVPAESRFHSKLPFFLFWV